MWRLPVLRQIASYRRDREIARALEEIRRLPRGQPPKRSLIATLHAAWGNPDFSACVSYLEAAARHAVATEGAVLECGSGLSTVLLGALAEANRFEVWTLEHEAAWHGIVARELQGHGISKVQLCLARLKDIGGEISWYDVSKVSLPSVISLVICDGPPNWTTPGARYGVIPVMRDHLAKGWNILLDDANAARKAGMLNRLASEPGIKIDTQTHPDGSFVWITRQ
jgi:hypothetical protein